MKHIYTLFLTLLVLAIPGVTSAQQPGKPFYRITVDRDGDTIGTIMIEMLPEFAPRHVRNFDSLVSIGFYNGTAFHRVIPGFMIQGGDPNSRDRDRSTWGTGEPGQYEVPAEFNVLSHVRGMLSAARTNDPNSATSQFFICHGNPTFLDGNYTIYGRVTSGIEVVDTIVKAPRDGADNPLQKHSMWIERVGIDTAVTPTPVLRSPVVDARHIAASNLFTWDSIPGAVMYYVQISRTEDFSVIDTTVRTMAPRYLYNRLKPGQTTYYWRVRATNGARPGEYSAANRFTTVIVAPVIISPATGSTIETTSPALSWSRVAGATSYRLLVSTRLAFTDIVVDQRGITDTFAIVNGLVSGTKYYWRVRGVEDTTAGPNSSNANFTVSVPTRVALPESMDLSTMQLVYEASGSVTVRFTLDRAAELRLEIIDQSGRDLRSLQLPRLETGAHQLPLDLSGLPSGTYLLRLVGEGREMVRTFQVVR